MTPEPVKVADFWGDFGLVETGATPANSPVVTVRAYDQSYEPEPLDFTAAQAREFAAAINAAADAIDPDGSTVTIPVKEYEALQESARVLGLLERGGVDNWEWYGEALSGGFE